MEYSGRTTVWEHKFGDEWKNTPNAGKECIRPATLFDVQWSNCPIEVSDQVSELWVDKELRNDISVYFWNSYGEVDGKEVLSEDAEQYPVIHHYLTQRGIKECIIYYWW